MPIKEVKNGIWEITIEEPEFTTRLGWRTSDGVLHPYLARAVRHKRQLKKEEREAHQ